MKHSTTEDIESVVNATSYLSSELIDYEEDDLEPVLLALRGSCLDLFQPWFVLMVSGFEGLLIEGVDVRIPKVQDIILPQKIARDAKIVGV